ncbi:MAG TPA: hypothetical protein VI452_17560 [Marmoricola sp.]
MCCTRSKPSSARASPKSCVPALPGRPACDRAAPRSARPDHAGRGSMVSATPAAAFTVHPNGRWDLVRLRQRYLKPGWPLAALFTGYPLWWALGVSELMFLVATALMALELARRRQILVPALFGVWVLFFLWTFTGPLVAQVAAPGTVPDVQLSRYFTWAYRMTFFVVATVALVYVCSLRLTARRLARILSVMFLVVVAGGWLGVVAPRLSFPSVTELLLPHRLLSVPFIYDQVHPTPAELQDYLGRSNARPSAPFSYANVWGDNYATLLPFFVRAWVTEGSLRRRVVGSLVLLVSVVPVVYSLNRGLWAVLIVLAFFVAVRGLVAGRVRMLAGVLAVVVLVTGLVLATPLQGKIEAKFTGHNSNEGRTNLSSLALVDAAKTSPVVGFGATRRVQGSFQSIAQGATASCPHCTPPAVGTQGWLWTVIFAYGLGGALLFVGFFVYQFGRNVARWRTADDTMNLAVLLVFLFTMPVYGFDYSTLVPVMVAVALLNLGRGSGGATSLRAYRSLLTGCCRSMLALLLAGVAVGGAVGLLSKPTFQATATVEIPLNHVDPGDVGRLLTMDEVAQVAKGTLVTGSVARSVGESQAQVARSLTVSALPNTRILNLTYTDHSITGARTGATLAVRALLAQQRRQLSLQRSREVQLLSQRGDNLAASVLEVRSKARHAGRSAALSAMQLRDLKAESAHVTTELVRAETASVDPGRSTGHVRVRRDIDGVMVAIASGAALGITAGLVWGLWWVPRRRRLGTPVRHRDAGEIRVLAIVDGFDSADPRDAVSLRELEQLVARERPAACVALDSFPESRHLAGRLATRTGLGQGASGERRASAEGGAVVVASTRTRVGRAAPAIRRLVASSIEIRGLVLVRPGRTGRDEQRPAKPPGLRRGGRRPVMRRAGR